MSEQCAQASGKINSCFYCRRHHAITATAAAASARRNSNNSNSKSSSSSHCYLWLSWRSQQTTHTAHTCVRARQLASLSTFQLPRVMADVASRTGLHWKSDWKCSNCARIVLVFVFETVKFETVNG